MKMPPRKRFSAYLIIVAALTVAAAVSWVGYVRASGEQQRVTAATVHITTISNSPDYSKPWQSKGTETSFASGAIIAGNSILTNAHAVAYAASIEVKRPGIQKSFLAHVEQIDHGCDLALLSVEDVAFFTGVEPLKVGSLAPIGAVVSAYGYPIGGETVSATSGVVSRVEHSTYVHSQRDLLLSQVDAAINPGNSGGPVVSDGKIVGIAMQAIDDAQSVGYMIPTHMIERFLKDAADGNIEGVPGLGAYYLPVESDALRSYLGLTEAQGGAMVADVNYSGTSWDKLKADDVVLAIDGVPVASDCTVSLSKDIRVDLSYLIERKQVGDSATLTVWRDRKAIPLTVTLGSTDHLVPLPAYPSRCSYRIVGGLVFQPATWDYLLTLGNKISSNLLYPADASLYRTENKQELIVMTGVLPHRVNRGYQDWSMDIVETVQGVPVHDFAQFNKLLDEAKGKWLNLTFDDKSRLVLDLDATRKANDEILSTFSIGQDRWPASTQPALASR